jgi:hypothetical protein
MVIHIYKGISNGKSKWKAKNKNKKSNSLGFAAPKK